MPRKPLVDYKEIIKAYKLVIDTTERPKLYVLVKRYFKNMHGNTSWEELSQLDKDIFIYETLRKPILKNYYSGDGDEITRLYKDVLENINKHLAGNLMQMRIQAKEIQLQHEQNEKRKFEIFYNQEKFDSIQDAEERTKAVEKAYADFIEVLTANFPFIPVPTLDEWIKENQMHPMNVTGYFASYISQSAITPQNMDNNRDADGNEEEEISKNIDHQINRTILMTIIKALREKNIVDINVEKITDCYKKLSELPDIDYRFPIYEYNPDLKGISKETQEEYAEIFKKYAEYNTLIEQLDFY